MFGPSSKAAVAAALLVISAQMARSSFACACAPCPLDLPSASRPEPTCCGEETPQDAGAACACPHFEAFEGLPAADDASMPSFTMPWEPPVQTEPWTPAVPAEVFAPGPAPPVRIIPIFLRNLNLRF